MLVYKTCCPQKKPLHSPCRMLIAPRGSPLPPRTGPQGIHASLSLVPQGPAWLSVLVLWNVAHRFKFSPLFLPHCLSPPPPPSCPLFLLPLSPPWLTVPPFPMCSAIFICCWLYLEKLFAEISLSIRWKRTLVFVLARSLEAPLPWAHLSPGLSLRLPGPPRPCSETGPYETCVTTWLAFTPGVWPFWCSLHFCFTPTVSNRRSVALDVCPLTFCIS